jgi:hypothetical protein
MKRHLTNIFVLLALLLCGCYDNHDSSPSFAEAEGDNCDLSEIQALAQAGRYDVDWEKICVCRVVSSDIEGNFYRSMVVEDESGTAEIKLGIYNSASLYPVGLVVALHLKGMTAMFDCGVMQIGLPPQNHDKLPRELESQEMLDRHIVRSNSVEKFEPIHHEIATLDSSMCGRLIAIGGLHLEPIAEEEAPLDEGFYRLADSVGNSVYLYISPYADFSIDDITADIFTARGILYRQDVGKNLAEQFVIKPRFTDDITTPNSDN